jgi:hypothetical protein
MERPGVDSRWRSMQRNPGVRTGTGPPALPGPAVVTVALWVGRDRHRERRGVQAAKEFRLPLRERMLTVRKFGMLAMAMMALTVAAACGKAPGSAAPSRTREAARYLVVVAPFNAANTALIRKSHAISHIHTVAQFKAVCNPLILAATRFDRAVLRIGLTGQAAVDARALVASNVSFIATFHDLAARSFKSELVVLERENAISTADGNHLRAKLGLPPVVVGG